MKPGLVNEQAIQSLVYNDVRARFGLSSQLAIHAVRRVASNRKTAKQKDKPVRKFAPTSATYDERVFSFREHDWTVSLSLLGGRQRFKLAIGNYQRGLLKGQAPKTATLLKRQNGTYYINIQLESQAELPQQTDKVLGIVLGFLGVVYLGEYQEVATSPTFPWLQKEVFYQFLQQCQTQGEAGANRQLRSLVQTQFA